MKKLTGQPADPGVNIADYMALWSLLATLLPLQCSYPALKLARGFCLTMFSSCSVLLTP